MPQETREASKAAGAVPIILDTDIGPDCDDAGALAVLHGLAKRGEARIVGVMHCTSSPWGAGCIDAINAYYGRPDIPVGSLPEEEGFLREERYEKYNRFVAQQFSNRFRAAGELHPRAGSANMLRHK